MAPSNSNLYNLYWSAFEPPNNYTTSISASAVPNYSIQSPIKQKSMIIKNLFKTEERRALENYGIVNGDNTLSDYGRCEFIDFLWETNKEAKEAFKKKIIEAYKERETNKKTE